MRFMADDPDTLRACLYRLAELVELARQLPPEDRARMECMIAQARQAVCEAREGKQRAWDRRAAVRAIVLRHLVKGTHRKAALRVGNDDISR
jgi:hypothetical protein